MDDRSPALHRPWSAPLLAVLALHLSCATGPALPDGFGEEAPVVIWFDNFRQVYEGVATHYGMLRPSTLDVRSRVGDSRCVGITRAVIVPPEADPPRLCDGMAGMAELTCSDGRVLQLEWVTEEACGRGYGSGQDAEGHRFHVIYGGSKARAGALANDALASLRGLPPLPGNGVDTEAPQSPNQNVSTGT